MYNSLNAYFCWYILLNQKYLPIIAVSINWVFNFTLSACVFWYISLQNLFFACYYIMYVKLGFTVPMFDDKVRVGSRWIYAYSF